MMRPHAAIILLAGIVAACASRCLADNTLIDFAKDLDPAAVKLQDAQSTLTGGSLKLATGHTSSEPGLTFLPAGGHWDLSAYQDVTADVTNLGQNRVRVFGRIESPDPGGSTSYMMQSVELAPSERKTLQVSLPRRFSRELTGKFFGMRGFPVQISIQRFDLRNVTRLSIFAHQDGEDHVFQLGNVAASGTADQAVAAQEAKFFPMIDIYGQYTHKDWPGKTYSREDFERCKKIEDADLAAHPGPADRDRFGGWTVGPQLKATGFFRTEKVDGKWWLVDPEGRLFWDHGIDWVAPDGGDTLVTGRESWFADLPGPDSPFAQFFHAADQGPQKVKNYNFSKANLLRKYGDGWMNQYAGRALRRLKSWRINVVAGGAREVYDVQQVPYTWQVNLGGRDIPTSEGYWGKFVDIFDANFEPNARQAVKGAISPFANDPWCLGVFTDNELGWGTDVSLPVAVLRAPADQPAKQAFLADLQAKYITIDKLNAAWGTQHASWDAFRECTTPPDKYKAKDDLLAFSKRFAERYFEIGRNAIKAAAPNLLYLGCRFSRYNDVVGRAAAKYCDIVSFNHYQRTSANVKLPKGVDKPTLISEFHFGALDRGLFHTGLVGLADQAERAKTYRAFVEEALDNPAMVGVHWFMYGDEATTAFGNEENYQLGFVDVCDTPYPEIIESARTVGDGLYRRRSAK